MALAERLVKQQLTITPERYANKVRWTAATYFILNLVSVIIMVTIIWRGQFFVTLSQRSNVETLALLIVFVLALYYVLTTFKGFVGALRILWLNSPFIRGDRERIKHQAIPVGSTPIYVCLDRAIRRQDRPDEPIRWDVADEAGKLGELELDGVKFTYYPLKDGMDNSIFEFMTDQLERVLWKRTPDTQIEIAHWASINGDQASQYLSMVQALDTLGRRTGGGPVWPSHEIDEQDIQEIGAELTKLVPTLRNEAHLPKLEYEVSYNIPVLPEPLGLLRLTRRDNRADPIVSMGCASFVMLFVLLLLVFFIFLPPWVPSK
jgi:hypothetical protein